jgi:Uncharacterized protein conserved in bacteria (DUF2252)
MLATRREDVLLAVGDLHVENFGVWRDSRSKLVWGVNDLSRPAALHRGDTKQEGRARRPRGQGARAVRAVLVCG